jgi:hypothetical protein
VLLLLDIEHASTEGSVIAKLFPKQNEAESGGTPTRERAGTTAAGQTLYRERRACG